MKKLTLTLCAMTALVSAAYAGTSTYSGKEMKQAVEQTPCPEWYADSEWNVGISGIYAPTANEWEEDTFLGVDHAWGGAIDAKYFFRRYFGVGIQAFGLSTNNDNDRFDFGDFDDDDDDNGFAGGVLGTFTFRYPIPCSRFAPYAWLGGGAIWGGEDNTFDFDDFDDFDDDDDFDDFFDNDGDDDGRFMAQYGLGFETRFTQRIGWTNDVSYNHVEGGHNDFWQFRSGVNFAF